MIGYKLIFTQLILVLSVAALGQPKDLKKLNPPKLKKLAKAAIEQGEIYVALDCYERYCELESDDADAAYQLAELYRHSRNYKLAQDWYMIAYDKGKEENKMCLFYYAQMLKSNGKYDDAKEYFEKFNKEGRTVENASRWKRLTRNELKGIGLAKKMVKEEAKARYKFTHLDTSINKAHIEFSPVLKNKNTLVYASLKADEVKYYDVKTEQDKVPVRKLYYAKKENDKWVGKGEFEGPFNEDGIEVGNGVFTPGGALFYFTRCERNKKGKMICQIYYCKRAGRDKWTDPEPLPEPINSADYTTTQPAIGFTSKKNRPIIYFVSDRPKGKGGYDIWATVYDSKRDRYSKPKNLGSKVNTAGTEMTPYIDPETKLLYYSSDGHPGIGGLDIFKAVGEQTKWKPSRNMGYPLNSSADDLYYTTNPKKKGTGFFTSNREGGVALKNPTCCDDIYSYVEREHFRIKINGNIYDHEYLKDLETYLEQNYPPDFEKDDSRAAITNSIIELYKIDEATGEPKLVETIKGDDKGNFKVEVESDKEYEFRVQADKYFTKHYPFNTGLFNKEEVSQKIPMDFINKEPHVLENIYYEFNSAELTEDAMEAVDTTLYLILLEHRDIIVEISSHTDSKGADEYNRKLSQKRAESVVHYLKEKGINRKRMIAKGYGEEMPIAENENRDGSDNPEGRARNRRTEFKVLE